MAKVSPIKDDNFESEFRRNYPLVWLCSLIGPFLLTTIVLATLGFIYGQAYLYQLIGTAMATFFFFGRFVILGGTAADPQVSEIQAFFSAEFLFAMVVYMDIMVASLLVFHASFIFKLPVIGSQLIKLAEDGEFFLRKNPWMRRAAFLGLVLFVTFPLAATGSVGGAIFSRILGMSRIPAFFAISAGSVIGCGIMFFGSQLVQRYLPRDNPFVAASGIVVVVAVIIFINWRYRTLKKRDLEQNKECDGESSEQPGNDSE